MIIPCLRLLEHGDGRNDCALGGRCDPAHEDSPLHECQRGYVGAVHKARVSAPKQAPPAPKPCYHLGAETGKTVPCHTCKGNVQLKTFRCGVHEQCTTATSAPGVQCCKGCTDYTDVEPLRHEEIIRVNLPTQYNCGMIRWRGKLLMVSRLGWAGSRVYLSELDKFYQPILSRDLSIQHPRAFSGAEDPRIVEVGDNLYVVCTGYESANGGTTSILVASLDDKLNVTRVIAPHYEKRLTWEKNWSPFEYDGTLHFVYTVHPHVVLRCEDDKTIEVGRIDNPFPWRQTALRGGAPSVRVGDEYYHWFHSVTTTRKGKLVYGIALYTFEAKPPFRPRRKISHVVMTADSEVRGWNKSVVFVCGAVLEDRRWTISYGQNDRECRVVVFEASEIERLLR